MIGKREVKEMRGKRIRNTLRNSGIGILSQGILLLLNFGSRKVFIESLGTQYLGLNGLFANLLAMLSLAEFGVGTAIMYHLYQPLAREDHEMVCSLMNFYKKVYHLIALVIAVMGIGLSFCLGGFIKELPFTLAYIQKVYLICLGNTVVSYFLSYRRSLLYADQKNYVMIKWDLVMNSIGIIVKVIALKLTHNYTLYLVLNIVFGILPNLLVASIVNRRYPYLRGNHARLDKEQWHQIATDIRNLFIHKVASFVVVSTDNLIISRFIGIMTVGLFSNYQVILTTLNGFMERLLGGATASLGDLATCEQPDRVKEVFKRLNFLCFYIASFCGVCLYGLLHDFIKLWLGEAYIIGGGAIELATLNMLLTLLNRPLWQLMSVSGLFKQDKYNALVEMGINLIFSLIFVDKIGLPGVFLGTTLSTVVAWILKTRTFFAHYLKMSPLNYIKEQLRYLFLLLLEVGGTLTILFYLPIQNPYYRFLIKMSICVACPLISNTLIFWRNSEYTYFRKLAEELLGQMMRIEKRQGKIRENEGELRHF